MPVEYHELVNVAALPDAAALSITRASGVHDAIVRHDDYELLEILRQTIDGKTTFEIFVVNVQCDGVPSRSSFGIEFRERLAICVPVEPKQLVNVLALRRDFPVLMHQNQGVPGDAANLCLYFETPAAVHRTWTPQNFLRRIQWWLEKNSRGELHPADQPVEQLFFQSRYELVLPWNFDALHKAPDSRFMLSQYGERNGDEDAGVTLFLEAAQQNPQARRSEPFELTLAPVLHGFVERDPATLGQLSDLLSRRGTELLPTLKEMLRSRVDEKGTPAASDTQSSVVLLHIPVRRTEGSEPSSMTRRAFIVAVGGLALGEKTGALTRLDKTYYREAGLAGTPDTDAWRALEILPMTILYGNSAARARAQSGLAEEGPKAVLIGAGSLGSAMMNIWSRSGWGQWTVIDKDHVKPHNLSRHVAFAQHIGVPKAAAVASVNEAVMQGAVQIRPLNLDASKLEVPAVMEAISSCALVVDASTTLEYPRAVSSVDTVVRHVSVFITPDGNAGVMLAEDKKRLRRLRTLEAQYYRALIQQDWGAKHLAGTVSSFWSGAGCRDISVAMPYSKVLNQASTLAEQVQRLSTVEAAVIRVWQRNPSAGSVELHEITVEPERRESLGPHELFFDEGFEAQLRELRNASFPNETGGVLLGYHDLNINALFIVSALPAPPDSKGDAASFERGVAGLKEAVAEAQRRTADVVGYVGEWHSHPPGYSAAPSQADLIQLIQMSLGMSDDGLPAVQIIVGEGPLQILHGLVK
ncbi:MULTISPECIES: ThiF family adenylyltransferase [Polaromonas]|uniref:ThiF family adenylyltransferase n=1 Tax=Polaromonas aquatica TaxID=332657 RepID=A0ABW1U083_9BURK